MEIVLAARRTRRGELAWGLAKGQIEEDLGEISYFYVWEGVRVRKSVRFYLMRSTGGDVSRHDHEMEDVRWFPLEEALQKAAYTSEREVLEKAAALLRE